MVDLVTPGVGVRLRGLRREWYEALVDTGALEGERIELLGGELVEMSPQGVPHGWVIAELTEMLAPLMRRGLWVRVQLPLVVDEVSVPEPDVAVTDRGSKTGSHPSTAHLVIEVSNTSQRYDLVHKAPRYATAGVPIYLVLDVAADQAMVHTEPTSDGYRVVRTLGPDDDLEVLGVAIDLARLLGT